MTTDSGAPGSSPGPTPSTSEPYRELIEAGLSHGRNAMSIWQEMVDRYGFTGAYESVKRYVRKLRGTQSLEARAIILTAPGEESQVDYGTGPMVRDAHDWPSPVGRGPRASATCPSVVSVPKPP